jgi:hypothetical protein
MQCVLPRKKGIRGKGEEKAPPGETAGPWFSGEEG